MPSGAAMLRLRGASGDRGLHRSGRHAGERLLGAAVVGEAHTHLDRVACVGSGERVDGLCCARDSRVRGPVVREPLVAEGRAAQAVRVRDSRHRRPQRLAHARGPRYRRQAGRGRIDGLGSMRRSRHAHRDRLPIPPGQTDGPPANGGFPGTPLRKRQRDIVQMQRQLVRIRRRLGQYQIEAPGADAVPDPLHTEFAAGDVREAVRSDGPEGTPVIRHRHVRRPQDLCRPRGRVVVQHRRRCRSGGRGDAVSRPRLDARRHHAVGLVRAIRGGRNPELRLRRAGCELHALGDRGAQHHPTLRDRHRNRQRVHSAARAQQREDRILALPRVSGGRPD